MKRQTRDRTAIHVLAVLVPALASLPAAYMIGRSTYYWLVLEWFEKHQTFWPALGAAIAIVAAIVAEGLGVVSLFLWSTFERWNRAKAFRTDDDGKRILKKGYDKAPQELALACFGGYILVVVVLLVVLEYNPASAQFAPVLFPVLTAVGGMCWAMYEQHRDRLAYHGLAWNWAVVQVGQDETKPAQPEMVPEQVGQPAQLDETGRAILGLLRDDGSLTLQQVGDEVGVSRSTVQRRRDKMERLGLLTRDGDTVRVLGNNGKGV